MNVVRLTRRALHVSRIAYRMHDALRSDTPEARLRARSRLAQLLEDARGLPMKIGQLMAGDSVDDPLRRLVSGVEPYPWALVEAELRQQLADVYGAELVEVDHDARAASLGQVHRGRLTDGSDVAVKVRYPGIVDAVSAELTLAGLSPNVGPAKRWGFDLQGYKHALNEALSRELDYVGEAARQARFRELVEVPGLVVPEVYARFARPGVLVQRWEDGEPFESALSWPFEDRLHVARILLQTLFSSTFEAGLVHSDPHDGNYAVRRADGAVHVVLYDFGCTLELAPQTRLALLQLICSLREGSRIDPLPFLAACGFDAAKLEPLDEALRPLCEVLFEPFLNDRPLDPSSWRASERIDQLLGDLKWWFRSAGPPSLLWLLRAFSGLANKLQRLETPLPWWPLLKRAVRSDTFASARALALSDVRSGTGGVYQLPASSRWLRIAIEPLGKPARRVCLPAREALDLVAVVPSEVLTQLHDRGVDVAALSARARETHLSAQVLFESSSTDGRFCVWLE